MCKAKVKANCRIFQIYNQITKRVDDGVAFLSVKHQKKNFFVGRPTCTVCRKEVSYALQGGENVEGHIKSSTRPKFSSALKQQQKSNFFLFLVDTVTKAYVKLNNLMVQQNIGYRLLLLRTTLALQ